MPSNPATFSFMRTHVAHWLALGFGTGLSPIAPGTIGTLWAWLVFDYLLYPQLAPVLLGLLVLAAFVLGVWASTQTAQHMQVADPGAIVWDEIVAFWCILYVLAPSGFWMQLWAFCLFRGFDTIKRGPVAWIDQHFKGFGWRGGLGIMLDDLMAALMTLVVLALWIWIFSF